MAIKAPTAAEPALARLDWESQHFGLTAAQLVGSDLTEQALGSALWMARDERVQWVVWPAEDGREVSPKLLEQFGGSLVDRKATFTKSLRGVAPHFTAARPTDPPVIPYSSSRASSALIDLAIVAGAYSRFHVDPHIPNEKFAAMYRLWIERSVNRELADDLLTVPADDLLDDCHERPLGVVTLSESKGVASIGLIAVSSAVQGRGIGSALMRAAHRWMAERGAHEARVVTQLANVPACRLYERSGYQLSRVQPYYHFWL